VRADDFLGLTARRCRGTEAFRFAGLSPATRIPNELGSPHGRGQTEAFKMTNGRRPSSTVGNWRALAALGLAGLATAGLLAFVNQISPVRDWLAIPLGIVVAWEIVLNAAFLCGGFAIVRRLLPAELPFLERLCISVAAGVTAFYLALFALGAVHLFRPWVAVILPCIFVAVGAAPLVDWWRRQSPTESSSVPATSSSAPLRGVPMAASIFGCLGVAVIYLGILSPAVINYDASWYHLPVAESYAREGRILPLDGNWHREYPHLANIIHTWGFLVPGLDQPALRWMMALHTELALFLWTLVGIAAGVRWMLRSQRVQGSWSAFFLFPGIFVYDGNLGGSADHVLGFFPVPLMLLSSRAAEVRTNGGFLLWGAIAGAALVTKYQAVYFIAPLGLLLVAQVIERRRDIRPLNWGLVRPALALLGGFVAVAGPHFLKNAVFHGNPVYPFLQDWFKASHPTVRDAAVFVENIAADRVWRAPAEFGRRMRESLELIFTFPFRPHYSFMGNLPTLGFAFTLSLPLVLVIRERRRIVVGALVSLATLFLWASTYRVDRHIQTFLPLLVVTTSATLVAAWGLGFGARVGVAALVGVQLVWAGDLYALGLERIGTAVSLIASGREGRARTRFDGFFTDQVAVGRALPRNAVILLHHWHPELGFEHRVYLDWVGFQGLIDYREFASARDLLAKFRSLGITHIVHLPGAFPSPYLSEMVLFESLAFEAGGPKTRFGQFEVFPLPSADPEARPELRVLVLGMGNYENGVYSVRSLDNCDTLPASLQHLHSPDIAIGPSGTAPLLNDADAVIREKRFGLDSTTATELDRDFQVATGFPSLTIYLRRAPAPGRLPFQRSAL